MKRFRCQCGNPLFFENSQCVSCDRTLGYLPDINEMSALEPQENVLWQARHPAPQGALYRLCAHRDLAACNWVIRQDDPAPFCLACRLNRMIPDLSVERNLKLWAQTEAGKRRLLYSLRRLGLPVRGKDEEPRTGLAFAFVTTPPGEHAPNAGEDPLSVTTGHQDGLITINVAEADDAERERIREQMQEPYRTLLGHFRHEIGHYYFGLLVCGPDRKQRFRGVFGDEREDYAGALARYYQQGPAADWQAAYISAYATAHPAEDWAESFAHYVHMRDTLETACDFGFVPKISGATAGAFKRTLECWMEFTIGFNALNRSMGIADPYPFVLSPQAQAKLKLIDELIGRPLSPHDTSGTVSA